MSIVARPVTTNIEQDKDNMYVFKMDIATSGCASPIFSLEQFHWLSITILSATGSVVGYTGRVELSYDGVNFFNVSKTFTVTLPAEDVLTMAAAARVVTQVKATTPPSEAFFHIMCR